MVKSFATVSLCACIALVTTNLRPVAAAEPDVLLCYESAWKVESATVYGDKDSISGKLEKYTKAMDLPKHRVYLLAIESDEGSEFTLFEYEKEAKSYAVTCYAAKSVDDLMKEVNDGVLASKGKKCVGEITKDILGKKFANKKKGDTKKLAVKDGGFEAFKKAVGESKGKFLRVTVTVLC